MTQLRQIDRRHAMTATTSDHATTLPPASPSTPRVCLVSVRASRAVLDGGWWPRSADPAAELPGLVLALSERYGPIRGLMLNPTSWDGRPRRLAVGTRIVRIGWFASVDPALAIATTETGDQLDLLVVPPGTAESDAGSAMARAADPTDTMRAPGILAAIRIRPGRPGVGATRDIDADTAWDNEGGYQPDGASRRTGAAAHPQTGRTVR
jgi:hypothetical protein